jgi:phosphoribosylaminoimidazolecarboxamide formyltransferase / IMP cyclohydrolase
MSDIITPTRALLSVSDKTGLIEFARGLAGLGIALISTGGTAQALREAGLSVTEVSQITGFPEIMDGRVKTLHPKIHGGLLGRLALDESIMAEHDIARIDLLVVNLYPFAQTIARSGVTLDEAIENIDIGGPAMVRAGAKNHARVMVLTDSADYAMALEALKISTNNVAAGAFSKANNLALRRALAAKAYAHTAEYDGRVASFLGAVAEQLNDARAGPEASDNLGAQADSVAVAPSQTLDFPPTLHITAHRAEVLRYGENPHQRAALYLERPLPGACVAGASFRQGKSLSFNNLADADAALECVKLFDEAACVIVKHANPCGVAVAATLLEAYERAYQTDPISAFGGIIAFNQPLDGETARTLIARQFVEVVIAPDFSELALAAFASKPNVRVLATGPLSLGHSAKPWRDIKRIQGGLLVQDGDSHTLSASDYRVVSSRVPSAREFADLSFAWKVAMQVKSNAIVYAKEARTVGIGAGQMSRVISAKIAGMKALEANIAVSGAVMASDAFFPFRDGIDAAAAAGIKAVIQPGGSMRDKEVIDAANEHGLAMLFTGVRHFKH